MASAAGQLAASAPAIPQQGDLSMGTWCLGVGRQVTNNIHMSHAYHFKSPWATIVKGLLSSKASTCAFILVMLSPRGMKHVPSVAC